MRVCVGESGKDESGKRNVARARAGGGVHVCDASERDDRTIAHGDRARAREPLESSVMKVPV